MMSCTEGEMGWESRRESLWKGGLRWMKKQRGLKREKWEQVNVPEILFLSKQDVLWCFIYKVTKAQKAEREGLTAKSTVWGSGSSSDRKTGWEGAGERERGDRWYGTPRRGGSMEKHKNWQGICCANWHAEQTEDMTELRFSGKNKALEKQEETRPLWDCSGDNS